MFNSEFHETGYLIWTINIETSANKKLDPILIGNKARQGYTTREIRECTFGAFHPKSIHTIMKIFRSYKNYMIT